MIKKLFSFCLLSMILLLTGNAMAKAITLKTVISPEGGGQVLQIISMNDGDQDRDLIKKSNTATVKSTDKISLRPVANDGYVFKKYVINGQDYTGNTFEEHSISEFESTATDGVINIQVVFESNTPTPETPTPSQGQADLSISITPENVGNVTFSIGNNGPEKTVENNHYTGKVNPDEQLDIEANLSEDYEDSYKFDHFLVNGEKFDTHGSPFIYGFKIKDHLVNNKCDIKVVFSKKEQPLKLRVNIEPEGTGSVQEIITSEDGYIDTKEINKNTYYDQVVAKTDKITLTPSPNPGYEFKKYIVNGQDYTSNEISETPITDLVSNGRIDIKVVFGKEGTEVPETKKVNLSVKVIPENENICTASVEYGDTFKNIENNTYEGEIDSNETLEVFASLNESSKDKYKFVHILVNGEVFNTNGHSYIEDFAVKDHIKDGKLDIQIVFEKNEETTTPTKPTNQEVNLDVTITPDNAATGSIMIDDRYIVIKKNHYSGEITYTDETLFSVFATKNNDFTFKHFLVNGEVYNTEGSTFIMDKPLKDLVKDGKLDIQIVFEKKGETPAPVSNKASLTISMSPENIATASAEISFDNKNDVDFDINENKITKEIDTDDNAVLSIYPTLKEEFNGTYKLKHFIINGDVYDNGGEESLSDLPVKDYVKDGKLDIQIVFEKKGETPTPPAPTKQEADLTITITPADVCTADFQVGEDGDFIDVENNKYTGKIQFDDETTLGVFSSINENFENTYSFDHFIINGEEYDSNDQTFFMGLPIKDYVKEGKLDIQIVYKKKGETPTPGVEKKSLLNINITPDNSCSVRYGLGYDDHGTKTTTNVSSIEIPQSVIDKDNVVYLNTTPEEGYEFVKYNVNGKEFATKTLAYIPIKENLVDGQLNIEVVCQAKSGGNTNNNSQLHPTWGQSLNPTKIEGAPKSDIVSDNDGNVYKVLSVAGNCDVAEGHSVTIVTPSALIVKYDANGQVVWTRTISGDERQVKGYNITLSNGKIYVVGSFENKKDDSQNIVAEKGDNGVAENTLTANGKTDVDLFVASYDLNGNLQKIEAIRSSSLRTEISTDMISTGDKLYISGYSEGFGDKPSYNGINTTVEGNRAFGFVFEVDPETLQLTKVYNIKGDDFEEVLISSLAFSEQCHLYFTGSTNSGHLTYNDNQQVAIESSPNALIFGELDLQSDKIKQLRILSDANQSIQGYSIATNSENIVYIGGNADENVVLDLQDGSKSSALNGNFIIRWDINQDKPNLALPIGTSNADNKVTSLVLSDNERVFFAGDYEESITINNEKSVEFGAGDSFFGSVNPETHEVDMFTTYGSSGEESATKLHLNKASRKLYLSGYYGGNGFSLYGVKNTQNVATGKNYYFAVFDVVDIIPEFNDEITISDNGIKVFGNKVVISDAGLYTIYNISGNIVKSGISSGNETIELENGIYIVKSVKSVKKVILRTK